MRVYVEREIGRTAALAQEVAALSATTAVLVRSLDEAARRFETVVSRLLAAADVVPLTSEVIRTAFGYRVAYGLSDPDSLVLASVLADLPGKPGPSCFLNRNTRDFSDPAIVAALTAHDCRSIPRFDDGVRFLLSRLPPLPPP